MKCYNVNLSVVSYVTVIYVIFIFNISNILTQNHGVGTGLPLPILREGHHQGQSAVRAKLDHNANRPKSNPPFIIKLDDDESIANPNLGIGLNTNTFKSNVNRKSARGPGFLHSIHDPSQEPEVKRLLGHPAVLSKIQKETGADSAVRIESVIAAHKQIVSGHIIYLDLKIVETRCPVGTTNLASCQVDTTEDPYICEVAIWERPWLNSTKIIDEKTRCAEVEKDNDFKNWNKGSGEPFGSHSEYIPIRTLPNHLDRNQVALEAFDYINRGSESKFIGQMINYRIGPIKHNPSLNITTIEVKVDYGFTLCLKFPNKKVDDRICPLDKPRINYVCTITVMSNPSLTSNLKVIPGDDDDIDCEKKDSLDKELVVPVNAVCMGCPQTVSLNDPSVLKVAEFAVIEHDRVSDDNELHQVVKLHTAQKQVVNGIKYYLTLELAETDCRKPLSAVNMNRTLCKRLLVEETDICDVIVLEKPFQQQMEMVSSNCYDRREYPGSSKDELIVPVLGKSNFGSSRFGQNPHTPFSRFNSNVNGGAVPVRAFSSSVEESVDFVLDEVNRMEMDDYDDGLYKVINIIDARTLNEPSGLVDRITVELGETVCTRRSVSANCPLKIGEDGEICSASVLRGNPSRLLYLDCEDTDDYYRLTTNPVVVPYHSVNRPFFNVQPGMLGAPGGPIEQPTTDSAIVDIARFIVDQYNLQSDEDELHRLSRVISSYSQVVSGSVIYTIELELLETICKKYQAVVDVSNCPIDRSETPEVCQVEVAVSHSSGGRIRGTKTLNRIFCDERRGFYIKKKRKLGSRTGLVHGNWMFENSTNDKMKHLGSLIADEFDFRSDEDNIFVLFQVLKAETEDTGMTHRLSVELAETVCPKYKYNIDKSRCAVDIGEEHKYCDAIVVELPWEHDQRVRKLRCRERDDSGERDDSVEIYYPRVHPSAHSRPRFLQSQYRIRQHSRESDESNEKYYRPGTRHRSTIRVDSDETGIDHDDIYERVQHRRFAFDDDDDDERDSDHLIDTDSRSVESFVHFRKRRTVMPGGKVNLLPGDQDALKVATSALAHMDGLSDYPRRRKVVEVIHATTQVVSGRLLDLQVRVSNTSCLNSEPPKHISQCDTVSDEPTSICDISVWEQPWLNESKVQKFECHPEA